MSENLTSQFGFGWGGCDDGCANNGGSGLVAAAMEPSLKP